MNFSQAFNPLRSLKSVFETMKLQPAQLWGGGILLVVLEGGVQSSLQVTEPVTMALGPEMGMILFCGACVVSIGFFLASIWLAAGLFLNFRSVLQTGDQTSGGIFDHQGKFLPLLLTRLLVGLVSVIALLPVVIVFGLLAFAFAGVGMIDPGTIDSMPGVVIAVSILMLLAILAVSIYVGMGVALSEAVLLFEGHDPVAAVKRSWALAEGNRLQLLLFSIVNFLFTLSGLLLCCVGVFATATIARYAFLEAFLQLSETETDSSGKLLKA
jgi:uncharacterized membrane protein